MLSILLLALNPVSALAQTAPQSHVNECPRFKQTYCCPAAGGNPSFEMRILQKNITNATYYHYFYQFSTGQKSDYEMLANDDGILRDKKNIFQCAKGKVIARSNRQNLDGALINLLDSRGFYNVDYANGTHYMTCPICPGRKP